MIFSLSVLSLSKIMIIFTSFNQFIQFEYILSLKIILGSQIFGDFFHFREMVEQFAVLSLDLILALYLLLIVVLVDCTRLVQFL